MSKFLKPLGAKFLKPIKSGSRYTIYGQPYGNASGYDLNTMPMKAKPLTKLEQEWLGMTVSTPTGVGQVWCITDRQEIVVAELDETAGVNRLTAYPKPEWGDLVKLCSVRNQARHPALFPPIEG